MSPACLGCRPASGRCVDRESLCTQHLESPKCTPGGERGICFVSVTLCVFVEPRGTLLIYNFDICKGEWPRKCLFLAENGQGIAAH